MEDAGHPGRVRLQVADLERSVIYYQDVLGLAPLDRDARRAVMGTDRGIVELHERPGAAPVPRGDRLGLFHFAILLPDRKHLGRLFAHLRALRIHPAASDHAVSEALYLWDPDGLGIEVYVDRPRAAWRHRGGQLVMVTEPLDLADLLRSGGDAHWTGMPPGAVIGHVHLHVGDLAAAQAFYHAALGLDLTVWNYPGALFFSAGGYHHHVGVNTWAPGAVPAAPDEARLLEWEWVVPSAPEAPALLERVAEAGYAVDGAVARDPWGTAVRIVPAA